MPVRWPRPKASVKPDVGPDADRVNTKNTLSARYGTQFRIRLSVASTMPKIAQVRVDDDEEDEEDPAVAAQDIGNNVLVDQQRQEQQEPMPEHGRAATVLPPVVLPATKVSVVLPQWLYVLLWLLIAIIHGGCVAYALLLGYLYVFMVDNQLMHYLMLMVQSIPWSLFSLVVFGYALFGFSNVVGLTTMLYASACDGELKMTPKATLKEEVDHIMAAAFRGRRAPSNASIRMEMPEPTRKVSSRVVIVMHQHRYGRMVMGYVSRTLGLWEALFGRFGWFGIESEYFDVVQLVIRALLMSCHTYQAYVASLYLSEFAYAYLISFLVVAHCWLTPAIQLSYQAKDTAVERLLYYFLTSAINIAVFVVIVASLILPYFPHYDPELRDFPWNNYFDDVWLIRISRELQYIVMSWWVDFIVLLIPLTTVCLYLSSIKTMLICEHFAVHDSDTVVGSIKRSLMHTHNSTDHGNVAVAEVYTSPRPKPEIDLSLATAEDVLPGTAAAVAFVARKTVQKTIEDDLDENDAEALRKQRLHMLSQGLVNLAIEQVRDEGRRRARQLQKQKRPLGMVPSIAANAIFFFWGAGVMFFQIRAMLTSQTQRIPGCLLEMRPWTTSSYACAVLELSCEVHSIDGSLSQVDAVFQSLHPPSLSGLVVSHCISFEMPSSIQLFNNLAGFKLYNTTVNRWGPDAAFTETTHSLLKYVFVIRSNVTEIPPGLRSDNFPRNLIDVEFIHTNLTALPNDINTSWHNLHYLFIELSLLEAVPPEIKLLPLVSSMSFAGNKIRNVPDDLFEDRQVAQLSLSANPIDRLPSVIGDTTTMWQLSFANTNVRSLPDWVNLDLMTHSEVIAWGTPLCASVDHLPESSPVRKCDCSSPTDTY